jgi:hypothetical protein
MLQKNARSLMADAKFFESYSRWDDVKGRYETWDEAVERVMKMHREYYADKMTDELSDLIDEAETAYKEKRVLGAQRALQFGGEQLLRHQMRLYNCLSTHASRVEFFGEFFYALLCGAGVGFSVQFRHIEKLSDVVQRKGSAKIHVVEDSIEGWAKSLDVLLSSFFVDGGKHPEFKGRRVYFDLSKIRPKGSAISGGFKAPGPEPLRRALDFIEHLLNDIVLNGGNRLKPIHVYDIAMYAADAVIAGGVRRSATICLFSPEDTEMAMAKTGDWYIKNPQRGRSNNSMVFVRSETTREQFSKAMKPIRQFGEPGFVFVDDPDFTFNPCVEIGKLPIYHYDDGTTETGFQGCVAYDTRLITKDGIEIIGDVASENRSVEIWNGERWSRVSPIKTNEGVDLYRVRFGDGSYLDATDYHKFLVKNRFQSEYQEVTTKELIGLLETSPYPISVPRSNIVMEGGVNEPLAYDYGFILGDGCATFQNGIIRKPFAEVYEQEFGYDFPFVSAHKGAISVRYGTSFYRVYFDGVSREFSYDLKYKNGLPKEIFSWDYESLKQFFMGWCDSDGSKTTNGLRIYGREDKIRDGQLLLSKMGIDSSVNLMAKKGENANGRVRRNDVWYIQVANPKDLKSSKFTSTARKGRIMKGKFQTVRSITKLEGKYDSYCFEEPELHQGVFNNVLTKQCNLTEINGALCTSKEDFIKACRAASIMGTLQAGYTDFKFMSDVTKKIFEREALIGCSITGWMNSPDVLLDDKNMQEGASLIMDLNKHVAKIIGINPAARGTCVKPSGNASVLLGTSSATSAEHSEYYIRNVQMSKDQEVAQLIAERCPYMVEESVWSTGRTDYVISFPVVAPEGSIFKKDVKAVEMLEIVKKIQQNWVEYGTDESLCVDKRLRHNVSNTINVGDDEWDEVENFVYDNRDHFAGIAMLGKSGDKDYNQAPMTSVMSETELVEKYGSAALFASGLIVDCFQGFANLWDACFVAQQNPADRPSGENGDQQADWVRRFQKFAATYFMDDRGYTNEEWSDAFRGAMKNAEYCLKDVYLLHRWTKIQQNMVDIDFARDLTEKTFTDIDTTGAQACAGGACEI